MEIKNVYLMWIGASHYPTLDDYVKEALDLGVSKRIINKEVGQKLMEPDTVVFVAHDNGIYHECPDCMSEVECPECRVKNQHILKKGERLKELMEKNDKKSTNRLLKAIEKINEEIEALEESITNCEKCEGSGRIKAGSGGHITFKNGETWEFRKYMYWKRQPKSFSESDYGGVEESCSCERCSGRGRIPEAKIFGLFVPEGIEYILSEEDTEKTKKEVEELGFTTKTETEVKKEVKRGCGFRKTGAYYVVTKIVKEEKVKKDVKTVVEKLIEKGLIDPEAVELKGNFVNFLQPIETEVKRFRGIKRWSLDPDVEEEAELALDALEV